METNIARASTIAHQKLDSAALVKWVLPTVVLKPFHKEAGVTLDDILFQNKAKLSANVCQRLTELLWPSFSESLRQGREVDAEEAKTHLIAKDHSFLRAQYAHVVFKHANNVFVAEYDMSGTTADVFRCWKAPSSDIHPTTAFVTFEDVAEKEEFDQLATGLGYRAEDLLLSLARDFAEKLAHRNGSGRK